MPAGALEWSLAPRSDGLSGLSTDEKRPEGGLGMAARFIHHVQSLHRHLRAGVSSDLAPIWWSRETWNILLNQRRAR